MADSNPGFTAADLTMVVEQGKQASRNIGALQRTQSSQGSMILGLRRDLSDESRARSEAVDAIKASHRTLEKKIDQLLKWHRHPAITLLATIVGTAGAAYVSTLAVLAR